MKGDIVIRIIVSFIIPFLILYSFSCIFYIEMLGMLSILNCCISIAIAYTMFHLRFGKIQIQKVISIKQLFNTVLFCFACFLCYLLIILLK